MKQKYLEDRLQDLRQNIDKCRIRIKQYEDEYDDEDDYNLQSKYLRRRDKLKKSVEGYVREYEDLKGQSESISATSAQAMSGDFLQIGEELAALKNAIGVVHVNQQALLASFDQHEQTIIKAITEQLNETQRKTVQMTVAAIESNRLSEEDMQQLLEQVRNVLVTVPQTAPMPSQRNQIEEILDDVSLDVKHKLKLSVPIIPLLLHYEAEAALGSTDNLGKIWNSLKTKLFG